MIDLGRLAGQGRAHSAARAWEPEELDALLLLERERHLSRTTAADYIRNGIMTLEAYDVAKEAEFKPKTLKDAADEADKSLKDNEFASMKVEDEPPAKKKSTRGKK